MRMMGALLLVLVAPLPGCTPATGDLQRIDAAHAVMRPQGGPEQAGTVQLRHRWDKEFPGRDGAVTYRLDVPASPSGAPRAALLEGAGNQIVVRVDGVESRHLAWLARPGVDAAKMPHIVDLPAGAETLEISASVQALRDGGLRSVQVGPRERIEALYMQRRLMDQVVPAVYAASLLLLGGLTAGLWWRQKEPAYGCFSLAAFAGSLRHIDRVVLEVPVPWALWGGLLAVAYGAQLALVARFVLLAAASPPRWVFRLVHAVTFCVIALAVLSFTLTTRAPWTAALWLLLAQGVLCFFFVLQEARQTKRWEAFFALGAGTLMLIAGLHDLLTVRESLVGASRQPLSQHALFFFLLLLAGMVVQRYSASVAEVRSLNASLTTALAQREAQLAEAFEAVRQHREQEAILRERQRIMRDIHDGVGSQLVGLLSLVRHEADRRPVLEQTVSAALDELRMAVDSQQPVHGDLATVLATLRYRLQPRLQAAGIAVVWDVQPLPPLQDLSPRDVLQIQRILLEAFTNVMRHSGAGSVSVGARVADEGGRRAVMLTVADDGIGIGHGAGGAGQGLRNMRARAEALGATLRIDSPAGGGTRVVLEWAFSMLANEPAALARPRSPT